MGHPIQDLKAQTRLGGTRRIRCSASRERLPNN